MISVYPLDATGYTAEPLGAYNGTRTRGVFSADDCFTVSSLGGRRISVSAGLAWLKLAKYWGVAFISTEPQEFTIDVANGVLSRYVAVVLQIDKVANKGVIIIKYGELASVPAKILPIQIGELFEEIIVSQILQRAASVEITAADITDLRTNETYCGVMRDGVTGIPTAQLQKQADALINQLNEAIKTSLSGALPDKCVTTAKFAPDALAPNGFIPYTYTKTDTVHKLTGTGANIKFTATAGFYPCESFIVNGNAVTCKNLAGFNAGDTVLCFLNGKELDFQQNYAQVLLWENARPNDSFLPQTVSLPEVAKYKTIMVTFKYYGAEDSLNNILAAAFAVKGDGTFTVTIQYPFGAGGTTVTRIFQNLLNGVYFGNGHKVSASAPQDSLAVPQKIYGIKGI